MKYMSLFASMAVICLLAGSALAAQTGNGSSANAENCNGNCIMNCQNEGTCTQLNCHAGEVCLNKAGNKTGPQDGTGPLRDQNRDQTCKD